jgi:hypothetical protein
MRNVELVNMIKPHLNGEILFWQMEADAVVEVVDKAEAVGIEEKTCMLTEEVEGEEALQQMQGMVQEDQALQMIWTMRSSHCTILLLVSAGLELVHG